MHKRIQWAVAAALTLVSPGLLALGLGSASVDSYLNQPLDVRVRLISQSTDELTSITAGLASVDDFKLLGLSRTAISVPLKFEIVTDSGEPHIRITSTEVVNEPVVQVLVEVAWASGRMLREYTLFLDPPTFESAAPPVAVKPAPPPAVREKPFVESSPAVVESAVTESAGQLPEPAKQAPGPDDGEVYGPVANGETLWSIAEDISRGTQYSVNQIMLALQRKNPDAFFRNNINLLKRGVILRLPAYSEVGQLTSREAMLEAMRQGQEFSSGSGTIASDEVAPTVADSGDYQSSEAEVIPEPVIEEEPEVDPGHLELVPPADEDVGTTEAATPVHDQAPEATDLATREELVLTEEELANAQQENTYLKDRIQELEAQQRAQQEKVLEVEDAGLASVESKLAGKRAEDKPEAPIVVTPANKDHPWYSGSTGWIIAIALLLVALIIWLLRGRAADFTKTEQDKALGGATLAATSKTENLLGILDRYEEETATKAPPKLKPEAESEPEPEPEPLTVVAPLQDQQDADEEGMVAGEDDPEVKLDLARAYLSLGDKEAAKSMLDEVLASGNEAQKAEAQQMLEEL